MGAHEAYEHFERAEQAAEQRERFSRHIAVLVAVLAACLAVSTLSANQAAENTILDQAKATDAFNELEANSLKKHINRNDAQLLKIVAATNPAAKSAASALEKAAAVKYAPNEAKLLVKARDYERQRDRSEQHHYGFELAEGAFQLAIVLASISIVARSLLLAALSGGVGIVGLVLLADGFVIFVKLH